MVVIVPSTPHIYPKYCSNIAHRVTSSAYCITRCIISEIAEVSSL